MSTIASPRDPSATPLTRRISNQPITPTGSIRGSLDIPRSANASPGPSTPNVQTPSSTHAPSSGGQQPQHKRANRAALREYYNLKKQQAGAGAGAGPGGAGGGPPILEVTQHSEVPASEIDAHDFDAEAYVQKALEESSLEELLRTYTRVLTEVRALDAEKKALVYDNYSKLISATETIRKMRANMDPLNPMASTLDPAIAQIYSQASSIRDSMRESVAEPDEDSKRREEELARQRQARKLAREVLETPKKLREIAADGKMLEARRQWEMPRRLLISWSERGVGGDDVLECLRDGDAAVGRTSNGPGVQNSRGSSDGRP